MWLIIHSMCFAPSVDHAQYRLGDHRVMPLFLSRDLEVHNANLFPILYYPSDKPKEQILRGLHQRTFIEVQCN